MMNKIKIIDLLRWCRYPVGIVSLSGWDSVTMLIGWCHYADWIVSLCWLYSDTIYKLISYQLNN